jgi:hypothetical protein
MPALPLLDRRAFSDSRKAGLFDVLQKEGQERPKGPLERTDRALGGRAISVSPGRPAAEEALSVQ